MNPFIMKLFDKQTGRQFFTTAGQDFYAMTAYLKFSMKINSTSFFGIGERVSNFRFTTGTYTLYPYNEPMPVADDGTGGKEGAGQHPLIICQLADKTFFGIFLFNSNAQEIIFASNTDGTTSVSVLAVGGVLNLNYLIGPSFDEVIQQYQKLVGMPALLPKWVHGLMMRTANYDTTTAITTDLNAHKAKNVKVEMVGLPLSALVDQTNFQYKVDNNAIKTQFPNIKFVFPYTYFLNTKNLSP